MPEHLAERSREYIVDGLSYVPSACCQVGSNARGIKPQGVKKIKTSIKDSGYARESIIQVKQASDKGCGKYLVIDGMHRVSALQELEHEKHPTVDYEQVSKHAHARTPLSHRPYC